MFFGKSKLSAEEIEARKEPIWDCINDDEFDKAFSLAQQLENDSKGSACYILGMLYFNGWGTEEDYDTALQYFKKAVEHRDENESEAWQFGGCIYLIYNDYENAIKWLENAERLGNEDVYASLGQAYSSMALDLRNAAAKTLKMNEYSQLNAVCVQYALKGQNYYLRAISDSPDSMMTVHYAILGRMVQLLFNLACRGELSIDVTDTNSVGTYLMNSFKMMEGRYNSQTRERWWGNVVRTCDIIASMGEVVIAEYFRALCAMLESETQKSAKAFYRAKWHFKRIGQLRRQEDPEKLAEIVSYLGDADAQFEKLDKKYGSLVNSMMRNGEYPEIELDYFEDAPAVESCDNFMRMFEEIKNASVQTPTTSASGADVVKSVKDKIFGFFGKRG